MEPEVTSALWDVEAAFVAHRVGGRRDTPTASLVRVDDVDPAVLVPALGVTAGDAEDVRALTPWLLRTAVTTDRLHLATALDHIASFWHGWTHTQREAVRDLVAALWRTLLDRHPGEVSAVAFLRAAAALGDGPERLLAIWEYKDIASADHHLADLVVDAFSGARVHPEVLAWALAPPQRERVRRAFARDGDEPWAADLAAASALLPD